MDSEKDNKNIFLPHISEPTRIKIAVNFAQHEFRKIIPRIKDESMWQIIDAEIENWPETLSINNFWNAIHGISMGFRLKSIVPWITSLNVNFTEENINIDNLWFGGKFGPIANLEILESSLALKENIFLPQNKNLLKQTLKILNEEKNKTVPRDHFPIFVIYKNEKFTVIDGNRRLLQAIINKKDKIYAVVGKPFKDPPLYEHFVPTSLLVDIVFWHKKQINDGKNTKNSTANFIAELILNSQAGRTEFKERAVHKDDKTHVLLLKAVSEILNKNGVKL